MPDSPPNPRQPVVLGPGEGRAWPMGRIGAVFKADGDETAQRYSISEWWLEPHTQGPGAHAHDEDDVFYVIEGTMSVRVGEHWTDAPRGSFVLYSAGYRQTALDRLGPDDDSSTSVYTRVLLDKIGKPGMSISEIGNALGLNTSATKHSIFRAVRKMRAALAPFKEGVGCCRGR